MKNIEFRSLYKKFFWNVTVVVILITAIGKNVFGQRAVPATYSSTMPVNYVRIWDPVKPESDAANITTSVTPDKFKMTTQYIDGLGRPLQTVVKQGSLITGGTAADLVATHLYDEYGREAVTYLPFTANSQGSNTHTSDGLFKLNPYQEQAWFYSDANSNSPVKDQGQTWYYSQVNYEASPLDRIQESFAAGNSWVGTSGNATENTRKSIKTKYYINTAADEIHIWEVTNDATVGNWGSYASSTAYPAGELFKTITVDENNKQVVEFKDKEGKVILKKVQMTATADDGNGRDHTGWLCTYYIYDDLNLLRCVIQPRGVELITPSWVLTNATILAEQCFRYEYDDRNRMIVKKVPGAGEVYMVYDQRDRLVFSQDANMRAKNQWMTTLYDALNRPAATGITVYTGTRSQLQAYLNDVSYTFTESNVTVQGSSPVKDLKVNYRQQGQTSYRASSSIEFLPGFTSEAGASFTAEIQSGSGTPGSIVSSGNPIPSGATFTAITQTFYDSYEFASKTYDNADLAKLDAGTNPYPVALPQTASAATKGLATGSRVWVIENAAVLSEGRWLETVNYYDDKKRLIQVNADMYPDGRQVTTSLYDFQGKTVTSYTRYSGASLATGLNSVKTHTEYDLEGRVSAVSKTVNDEAGTNKTIVQYEYDALGQVKTKKLGAAPLETLAYDYDIRGWLLGANRDYVTAAGPVAGKHFGFDLGYDKNGVVGSYTPQYTGNISGIVWKSEGDREKRKYDFSYDAANRITAADFNQYTGSAFNKNAGVDFSLSNMTYDANGNILTMNQNGLKLNTSPLIDQLAYTYQSNSNKLSKVVDAVNDNSSTLGDFKYDPATKGSTDYTYDANGNLTKDDNKKISSITYNYLNLPQVITITGKGTITFTYDAAGNKLKKVTVDNTVTPAKTTTTIYIGGAVYENDQLQFVTHEEGRIRPIRDAGGNITAFTYDYFLKDHLDNVRMVLTEEQKTDAYPPASMETAQATTEETLYANVSTTRIAKPSGYPTDNYTNPNNNVAKVNGSGNKIGPAIILKVMAGDKFNLRVSSWYKKNGATPGTPNSIATDLVASLIGGLTGVNSPTHGAITSAQLTNSGVMPTNVSDFLSNQPAPGTVKPKAYLNWVLLDEQFKFVQSGSGAEQVGDDQVFKVHTQTNLPVTKSGYLYVFVSNETPNIDVFFDNLQVTHIRGAIVEEKHYYPFGLTMAGINYKSAGGIQNKIGITGKEMQKKEFNDGSGLNLYDFGARMQDPQLGRWNIVDPMVVNYYWLSPYNYCNNNPIKFLDPNGMEFVDTVINGKKGRYDIAQLSTVTIIGKSSQNNSLADRVFPWANAAASSSAKRFSNRVDIYTQARYNGWSQQKMRAAWGTAGISDYDLNRFERYYQSEVGWRNMSLVSVGVLGAPVLATAAPGLFAGTMTARLSASGADLTIQYAMNIGKGYGFLGENISNINIASVVSNFAMPGSALGSSVVGNSLNFSLNGYNGVSTNASGTVITGNILLGYGGNLIGNSLGNLAGQYMNGGTFLNSYVGNIHGNVVSGSAQFINELINGQ